MIRVDVWNLPIMWFLNERQLTLYKAALVIWIISEVIIWFMTSKQSLKDRTYRYSQDKRTFIIIVIGYMGSIYFSLLARYELPFTFPNFWGWFGIGSIIIGVIVRVYSVIKLKESFSLVLKISRKQELIKTGIYKYIRHPAYLGSIISLLGFSVTITSPVGIVLTIVICTVVYSIRIRVEEQMLIELYGNEYLEYMRCTKKIIPFIV